MCRRSGLEQQGQTVPFIAELNRRSKTVSGIICGGAIAQDEPFDRIGKALLFVGCRYILSLLLHLWTGIPHRNTQSTTFKHRYIIWHIPDCGNLLSGDSEQVREAIDHSAFIRVRMGYIQVVGLGSSRRHLRPSTRTGSCLTVNVRTKRLLNICFTSSNSVQIITNAHNFDHVIA